ncbi:N-acetyl sugar amidotransferase [Colwellia psychrerythraea]|uniref:N-acetyl sugar amidotransferase n=1 Tax=Colwellia psychrerythraea TaxID=28229 RepID=A0A099L4D7_COLPS|nr:N-acetyl sugar amidotransferase [Colwellia psychrerythraea]KGJ97007.1 N-acetyl sugar amidotransferase [Colwellia psychrerythraea]
MKYCKSCLTTNLRPNSSFKDGICIACHYSDSQAISSSSLKLKILQEKIKSSRQKQRNKGAYDCIVGVSGGKDSTRQAHWVRDRLGLRPLLICCAYPPKQMTEVGANNLSNLIKMGFDMITATPAPKSAAKLALESFKLFGNVCKSTEMSLFSTVPRLAIELGVNTIFWGENPALQVGDAAVEGFDEFDGNNLRKLNTLTAGGTEWINSALKHDYLVEHYLYPEEILFDKKDINIFYLGPAWDDWSNDDNSTYAALEGLTLRPGEENITGDLSNASMLDEEFTNINMMLKYYKFGFGRATDTVNEKIRSQHITREQGIEIVERYDGVCDDSIIQSYSKYVDITETEFWNIANKWVNKNIFTIKKGQRPIRKFTVGTDYGC